MCKQFNKDQLDKHDVLQKYCTKGNDCSKAYSSSDCKACPNDETGTCLKGKTNVTPIWSANGGNSTDPCYERAQSSIDGACTDIGSSDYDKIMNLTVTNGTNLPPKYAMNSCRSNVLQDQGTNSDGDGYGMCTSFNNVQSFNSNNQDSMMFMTPPCTGGSANCSEGTNENMIGFPCSLADQGDDPGYCCQSTNAAMPLCSNFANDAPDLGYCSGSSDECSDDDHFFNASTCNANSDCTWNSSFACTSDSDCEADCNTYCDGGYKGCGPATSCSVYDADPDSCDYTYSGQGTGTGCGTWACVDVAAEA